MSDTKAFPTRIMKVRRSLGRCSTCWSKSSFEAVISAEDVDGKVLRSITLNMCQQHRDESMDAILQVPHKGSATLKNGMDFEWESPAGAQ